MQTVMNALVVVKVTVKIARAQRFFMIQSAYHHVQHSIIP